MKFRSHNFLRMCFLLYQRFCTKVKLWSQCPFLSPSKVRGKIGQERPLGRCERKIKVKERQEQRKLSSGTYNSAHRSLGNWELLRHWGTLCQDLMDGCFGFAHLNRKTTDKQHPLVAYILCVHINPSTGLFPQLQRKGYVAVCLEETQFGSAR